MTAPDPNQPVTKSPAVPHVNKMKATKQRAKLRLLPVEEGGRKTAIRSGYRSLIRFHGSDTDFGFQLDLDAGELAPGDSGYGELSFWAAVELPSIKDIDEFEIREGSRVVGYGESAES